MLRVPHPALRMVAIFAAVAEMQLASPAGAQTCTPPPNGIVAWWPFDETTGAVAQDRIGEFIGAHINGPTFAAGKVGGSLRFDGADDYVEVSDNDLWAFGTSEFSIELWANFDAAGGGSIGHPGDIFIGNDEGPGTRNKWFFALGGGVLNFHINGSPGSMFFPRAPFSPVVGEWYHLAITRKAGLYTIYIDGVPAISGTDTRPVPNANAPLTIGQAEQIGFMNGRLDEVAIYHRAISQEEVRSIFEAGGAGKCAEEFRVQPTRGGDAGSVTLRITGGRFQEGATALLRRAGESDLAAGAVSVQDNGSALVATFDLAGQAQGARDVVIRNPGAPERSLEAAFTIEASVGSDLWVDVVGLGLIRPGRPQSFTVFYGNRGNVDAVGVPLWIEGIPPGADVDLQFEVRPPLPLSDPATDLSGIPSTFDLGDEQVVPLLLPVVPAGHAGAMTLTLTVPPGQAAFPLSARIEPAWYGSPLRQDAAACLQFALLAGAKLGAGGWGCAVSVLEAYSELLVGPLFELPTRPINLVWAIANIAFQCAVDGACTICIGSGGFLTPSCVVCGAGEIVKFGKDIADALRDGGACGRAGGAALLEVFPITSFDPNAKVGPTGVGEPHYCTEEEPLRYAILFENVESATAPAQEVVIDDVLDATKLDLDTFNFGPVSFGEQVVVPPVGATSFTTDVDLRPDTDLLVRIRGVLDRESGALTWRFTSIDPNTGDAPSDPRVGFLPPNLEPPEGDGRVLFTVEPQSNLPTGTEIRNQAEIVFDVNDPIVTPQWLNTIDETSPTSRALPLAAVQDTEAFDVAWSGNDDGAGIRAYTVFVSVDGGVYLPFVEDTAATSAVFQGENGRSYEFFSIAEDRVGNVEGPKSVAEAATRVATAPRPWPSSGCGLGPELVLLLPPILWLTMRRRAAGAAKAAPELT